VPVAAQFRRQDRVDNASSAYVGDLGLGANPRLVDRLAESDLVVLLGGRFSDVPSGGYTRLPDPRPAGARLAHVHADPAELGRVWSADLPIAADADLVVAALLADGPLEPGSRRAWADELRADYEDWSAPRPRDLDGVDLAVAMRELRDRLPDDAIVCNGAGNYAVWVHRHLRHRHVGTQLAPTSGAMGYGLPAAIAASLRHPDRAVAAVAGDGCFQMSAHELATAAQEDLRLVVIVCDNGMLGTIRMHQERSFPGRVSGTTLDRVDVVRLAEAHGCLGRRVERDGEIADALDAALAADRPAVVHLLTDPRAITPTDLMG
jgi:acetolactate synthase-1/2/3 large subunit